MASVNRLIMSQNIRPTTLHFHIEEPLKTDCKVSGVLRFVLLLSTIAGIAPLKFERTSDGWIVRVSRFSRLYSYIILVMFLTGTIIYHVYQGDAMGDNQTSNGTLTVVRQYVKGFANTIWIIVTSTIFHKSYGRMRRMIDCVSQLTLINKKLNKYDTSLTTSNTKLWVFVCMSLIFGYVFYIVDYGIYMYDMILVDRVGVLSCSMLFQCTVTIIFQLYAIQFALIVMLVVSTIQRVNTSLKIILHEIRSDLSVSKSVIERFTMAETNKQWNMDYSVRSDITSVIHTHSVMESEILSIPDKIRQLSIIYCSLCDIIRHLNISDGGSLLATLVFTFSNMVLMPYLIFSVIFTSTSEIAATKCIDYFMCALLVFIELATVVEPCHRAHEQLLLTKKLIHRLLRYTGPEAAAVRYELKLFKLHILLNPVSFSPWKLLTFKRTTLVMAVSLVVTNITVIRNL